MRYFYTFFFFLISPLIVLRLVWRSRQNPAYRKRLGERFGFFKQAVSPNGLWVHAVSLGEVIAVTPLILELRQLYPQLPITFTTMTITGSAQVQKTLAKEVFHVYVPYDLPFALQAFLKRVQPRACVIVEKELWPNLLETCHLKNIPVILVNAQLSARSFHRYQFIKSFIRSRLSCITLVSAQGLEDAHRFLALGLDPQKITVTGSLKFDRSLPPQLPEQIEACRPLLGPARLRFMAASTHEGEEESLLFAFQTLKKHFPDLLLLWAPRHPERFKSVEKHCHEQNLSVVTRRSGEFCTTETDVFLIDTIGELLPFYALAEVAFVGGSFVPVGGHNVLEPVSLGKPTLVGPHMFNSPEVTQLLTETGVLFQASTWDDMTMTALNYLKAPSLCTQIGQKGIELVEKNKGALSKNRAILEKILSLN